MNEVAKISRTYLIVSIAALALVFAMYIFMRFIEEPPIFIPPADEEVYLFEEGIKEATNLDGLKNSCARFAKCYDDARAWQRYYFSQLDRLYGSFGIFAVFIFSFFGWGYLKIYRITKRGKNSNGNAR
ncbi:MAG: hypothetical protein AAF512_04965 [Pseudomonadota bacterium]